jgi:hypothetical protein
MLSNGQATAIGRFYLATVAPRALSSLPYTILHVV